MALVHKLHPDKIHPVSPSLRRLTGDGGADQDGIDFDTQADTPIRYVSLDRVYSAQASVCCVTASGSSNVMSKKVKARKLLLPNDDDPSCPSTRPPLVHVYSRRPKCLLHFSQTPSFFNALIARAGEVVPKIEVGELEDAGEEELGKKRKRKRLAGKGELANLGVNSSVLGSFDGRPRLRDCRNHSLNDNDNDTKPSCNISSNRNTAKLVVKKRDPDGVVGSSAANKRWVRLSFDDADPNKFIGLACKIFWPLDADWYSGRVIGYNPENNRHSVEYADGDKEDVIFSNEKVKFYISGVEMEQLNLNFCVKSTDGERWDYDEMLVLAASLDDCQDFETGDIIWAKLTGHAMWPAVVVDESLIGDGKGLNKTSGGRSISVHFFGTHDFARIKPKQVISFLKGLLSSFHLKCKKPRFARGLEEAKMYLSEQKLPKRMLELQNGSNADSCERVCSEDEGSTDSGEDFPKDEGLQHILGGLGTAPYVIGDLQILSLGKIVKDSEYFQDDRFIWPEGYTALRKFTSITDPNVCTTYKMEVLRDAESKIRPLFRVTLDNGKQIKGSTPSACWNKIYRRIRKIQGGTSGKTPRLHRSGSDMFGFSSPQVMKRIKGLSKSKVSSKTSMSKLNTGRFKDLPHGYRPVRVDWKDLDKCNVCHMDEEYENNLFLQCDKCRMMVHARCYGELEPVDGVLWFCNLCRPGAPDSKPPCCLCPVIGGAMKPTSDGRWAHLTCAMWIPETCLSDVKRMEPIDGINRISKDRWKLLCSICAVAYGACIQCSNNTCRVAYHPLCARAAGLCVELEDEDRLHLLAVDDDENQCIRLLSFCKKHRSPSNERPVTDERVGQITRQCSDYTPPCNPSGCARTEPYNYFGRRGRKEPEALAAASLKRLFVENQPHLVGGYCQHEPSSAKLPSSGVMSSRFSISLENLKTSQLDAPNNILSMAEKYNYMRQTFQKRLTFGKSGIHGFGIFAKHPHRAGDMVIEYIGELVRPPIADRRERFIYNSLVGAGTYMFRIDDERVIDATRAGSIAHLINHSCEPNCYSRVISVNGDKHIIIFAKRDIKRWEELTYDYRFFSIDEQLACYCGFPRCRGVVNDVEAEEQVAKLNVPRSELIEWNGE